MTHNDKKNKDETEEEQYTGTPEQQLPDLEAEEQQDRQKEQYEETARTGKEDESENE